MTAQIAGSSAPPSSSIAPSPQARSARAVAPGRSSPASISRPARLASRSRSARPAGVASGATSRLDAGVDRGGGRAVPQRRGRPAGLEREVQRRPARPEPGQRAVVRRRGVGERAAGVEEVAELARERRAALDTLLRAEALDRLAQPVGGGGLGRGRLGAAEVGEDRRAIVRPRRAPRARGAGTSPPAAARRGAGRRRRPPAARPRRRDLRRGPPSARGRRRARRARRPRAGSRPPRRCAAARSVAPISS